MIELKILVDDIDYNSLTELLVPLLAEKLEKEARAAFWAACCRATGTWR